MCLCMVIKLLFSLGRDGDVVFNIVVFCVLNIIFFFSTFFYILILVVFLLWLEVGDKVMSALAGEATVSGVNSRGYRHMWHDAGWG